MGEGREGISAVGLDLRLGWPWPGGNTGRCQGQQSHLTTGKASVRWRRRVEEKGRFSRWNASKYGMQINMECKKWRYCTALLFVTAICFVWRLRRAAISLRRDCRCNTYASSLPGPFQLAISRSC